MCSAKRLYDSISCHTPGIFVRDPQTLEEPIWKTSNQYCTTFRFKDGSRFQVRGGGYIKTITWGYGKVEEMRTVVPTDTI